MVRELSKRYANDASVRDGVEKLKSRLVNVKNANQYAHILHTAGGRPLVYAKKKTQKPLATAFLKTNKIGIQDPSRRKTVSGSKRRLFAQKKLKNCSRKKPHCLLRSVAKNHLNKK